jgi:hypothetical protein
VVAAAAAASAANIVVYTSNLSESLLLFHIF